MKGDESLRAEMRQLWDNEIVTATPSATILDRLPPEVVRFLKETGLPQSVPAFDFELLPPDAWKIVALGGANRDAGLGEFLVLCHREADVALGIDLATGRVFTADLRGEEPPGFLNSSLPLYVQSLVRVESWRRARPDVPGLIEVDRETQAKLEELDPEIASYELSIWPGHFDDLQYYY